MIEEGIVKEGNRYDWREVRKVEWEREYVPYKLSSHF